MKPHWKSKTLWFNFAVMAFAALQAGLPQFQVLTTPTHYALFSLAVGMGNMILRQFTTQALGRQT
jgi:hypothetical protein